MFQSIIETRPATQHRSKFIDNKLKGWNKISKELPRRSGGKSRESGVQANETSDIGCSDVGSRSELKLCGMSDIKSFKLGIVCELVSLLFYLLVWEVSGVCVPNTRCL
jgi:hypothetical protein